MLQFITGNKNKFEEVRAILGDVHQFEIDLPEIQEIDSRKIIEAKLRAAVGQADGEFIIEDTSLTFEGMNGLPGPLIKWFLGAIGNKGLAGLAVHTGNDRAEAKTIVGYAKKGEEMKFFEGIVKGRIVEPRGGTDFGWDPIFVPDGHEKTFAEMSRAEKNGISMRRIALEKLKKFISG
jgi:inosine triphosphate pyrophosphatase